MKIIYNSIIPFKGFTAINICGIVFARKEHKPLNYVTIKHEIIHTNQMKQEGYFKYYIKYIYKYLKNVIKYKNFKLAYMMLEYEQEAYINQYK